MIIQLQPRETARLDKARLAEIVARLGPRGADDMITRGMEELAVQLAKVHRGFARSHLHEIGCAAQQVQQLAHRMGMPDLARVARDAQSLSCTCDGAALAAAVSRLGRLGEASLMKVWDLQDLSG